MPKTYHRYRDDGTGNIFEKNGAFHVRWWYRDADGRRKQRSKMLCRKSREHNSTKSKSVLNLAAQHMAEIKINTPSSDTPNVAIVDFFEQTYLPWQLTQLKPSSAYSMQQIWNQHLRDHFGEIKLREYRTHQASRFLTELARRYGRNTVQHVRAAMSGVFSYAVNTGLIESNPVRECKVLAKTKPPANTEHYTLDELIEIVSVLTDDPELQLLVCLAGFQGLRPGEIRAARWEDIKNDQMHVQRGAWRSHVGTPKTDSSVRVTELTRPAKLALEAWRAKCGAAEGWIFPGRYKDRPGSIVTRTRRLRSILKANDLPWKTLYAGRRGAATTLTLLTGNPLASAQLLGHKTTAVTMNAYVKQDRSALTEGMRLLEGAIEKK